MRTIGARVRERLKELDQSQHWLAREVGIKQPSINAIINSAKTGKAKSSKHLVKIAEKLGVYPKWLSEEVGPKLISRAREAVLVGKVGAGAEVTRFDEGVVLEGIEPPPGVDQCLAARISGDSMFPFEDGWLIFYTQEHAGIPEEAVGKLAVVGLKDNTTLVKKLKRGSRKGLWRLESWNAPPREDVPIAWASRVIDIRPT